MYAILFLGFTRDGRHEGIFIFAIVLLVVCICVIIIICLLPWYCRRRREKQQAKFVQFSWTEGVDILAENEPNLLPSSIIKTDIIEHQEEEVKKEKPSLLVDLNTT